MATLEITKIKGILGYDFSLRVLNSRRNFDGVEKRPGKVKRRERYFLTIDPEFADIINILIYNHEIRPGAILDIQASISMEVLQQGGYPQPMFERFMANLGSGGAIEELKPFITRP